MENGVHAGMIGLKRSALFAVIGWLSLSGAAQPNDVSVQSNQDLAVGADQNAETKADVVRVRQSSELHDPSCERGEENRKSELCAQWKAADSASDAANWSFWQMVASFGGLLIGIGTLVFAARAAHWAKQAAVKTGEGAQAGREAVNATLEGNKISRESDEKMLRPWLSVEVLDKPRMDIVAGVPRLKLKISIENKGQSPAISISYFATICIGHEPDIGLLVADSYRRKDILGFISDIFQGSRIERETIAEHTGPPAGVEKGYLCIAVFYKSVFSQEDRTTAIFFEMQSADWNDGVLDFSNPLGSNQLKLIPWAEWAGVID